MRRARENRHDRQTLTRRLPPPLEHRILTTAVLCLIALGAVMVYSASSPIGTVNGGGFGASEFLTYLLAAAIGLVTMRVLERGGLQIVSARNTRLFLLGSFVLLVAVLLPGIGRDIGGARRWIGAGPLELQPSELMKLALVLYVARYLADHPSRMGGFRQAIAPVAIVVVPACVLIYREPDLGTMLVVGMTVTAMLFAAGMPLRYLAGIAATAFVVLMFLVMASAYQRARLTAFLDPWAHWAQGGYQSVQGQVAVGSGGLFGVGLGRSLQKVFYLPEAQTDFILGVVGEELGLIGITSLVLLYGLLAYAGLRTARRAASRYAKLLATGLTSLILCQGILNIFVVLGLAPLTGVPLPFISYAPTNLIVMLASTGLLLNVARPGAQRLRAIGGSEAWSAPERERAADRDRSRRDGGARGAGAGRRGRAAS
jgi:cell division protein FtsW